MAFLIFREQFLKKAHLVQSSLSISLETKALIFEWQQYMHFIWNPNAILGLISILFVKKLTETNINTYKIYKNCKYFNEIYKLLLLNSLNVKRICYSIYTNLFIHQSQQLYKFAYVTISINYFMGFLSLTLWYRYCYLHIWPVFASLCHFIIFSILKVFLFLTQQDCIESNNT